jgi:hypothetical protein
MKSKRYRSSKDKFWRNYNKKMSLAYYKRGLKYGERILPSGFFESQGWGALRKSWKGFVIAKEKMEWDKIEIYAKRINKLQRTRNSAKRLF